MEITGTIVAETGVVQREEEVTDRGGVEEAETWGRKSKSS